MASVNPKQSIQKEFYMKYPDVYKNWKYFYLSHIHCVLYFLIFSISYILHKNCNNYFTLFLLSWLSGYGLFGLVSIGHDAAHKAMFPNQLVIGNILNQLYSWLFVDCLIMSNYQWSKMHWEQDHYGIISDGIPIKYYGIYGIYHGLKDIFLNDFGRIYYKKKGYKRLIVGMLIRYYLWFNCGLCVFIFNTITSVIWMNIFFNIPHVNPIDIDLAIDKDLFIIICKQTWDIMPNNYIISFISFGLNSHTSHHCFPTVPRSLHIECGKILKKHLKYKYRACTTYTHYSHLFKSYFLFYMTIVGLNKKVFFTSKKLVS